MKKEVKIGIFTIIIILSAWGVLRFLGGSNMLGSDNTYYAIYDDINGVQNSSQIFIRGVKVGVVSDIYLDLKSNSGVKIKLSIESKYEIPNDSEAKIVGNGLMSPMAIEIEIGQSNGYLTSGDTIESSREPGLLSSASNDIDFVKRRLDNIARDLSTTLLTLNELMTNNATQISGVTKNMEALTYNLNKLLEQNEHDVKRTVSGIADLSETLGNNKEQIDSIILNINNVTRELSEAQISTNLNESLTQINTLLSKINNEEGSIGKIMSDEALYQNLAAASGNLDSLLFDMRQYPSRYVHFSVFGRDDEKQMEKAMKKAEREAKKEAK